MSEHEQVDQREEFGQLSLGNIIKTKLFQRCADCDDVSVFHCGERAEVENRDPENYPWIEPQRSETIYCTI